MATDLVEGDAAFCEEASDEPHGSVEAFGGFGSFDQLSGGGVAHRGGRSGGGQRLRPGAGWPGATCPGRGAGSGRDGYRWVRLDEAPLNRLPHVVLVLGAHPQHEGRDREADRGLARRTRCRCRRAPVHGSPPPRPPPGARRLLLCLVCSRGRRLGVSGARELSLERAAVSAHRVPDSGFGVVSALWVATASFSRRVSTPRARDRTGPSARDPARRAGRRFTLMPRVGRSAERLSRHSWPVTLRLPECRCSAPTACGAGATGCHQDLDRPPTQSGRRCLHRIGGRSRGPQKRTTVQVCARTHPRRASGRTRELRLP